ncbi:MAG: gamma-glutamylcyclotransferase [Myxococcaceae bacterium]
MREQPRGSGPPPVPEAGEVAEALDVDLVYDVLHPDWGGRIPRLVEAPGHRLWGRARPVPPEAVSAVCRLEADLGRATEERRVRVRTAAGALSEAVAFSPPATGLSTEGPVSERYLRALALSAERAGLPVDYVQRLQAEAQIVATLQQLGRSKRR